MLDLKAIQLNIQRIAEERGLKPEQVVEAFESSLGAAYKKAYRKKEEAVRCVLDFDRGKMLFFLVKTIRDPVENPDRDISLEEGRKVRSGAALGEDVLFPLEEKEEFTRIAAQTAKQVILHQLKEFEKENAYNDFKGKEKKIVWGVVQKIEKSGIVADLGRIAGMMFFGEAIPNERYRVGQRLRFFVYAVEHTPRGPQIFLSRAHPDFLQVLFEAEVPEISEGVIVIKAIAREPGIRSKVAVASTKPTVDPIGACVGPKGSRILTVTNELNGEKIDIIVWSDDQLQFAKNAISPAKVDEVVILPRRTLKVIVAEDQISLAIGKNGQNVKLAAKLTGWRIDVRSVASPEVAQEFGSAAPVVEAESVEPANSELIEVAGEDVQSSPAGETSEKEGLSSEVLTKEEKEEKVEQQK